MSLLVWLPLNGNDNNYGLNKVTLTGNGGTATYLDGKIGKCLLVNGRYITISPITLSSEASVCYWSKTTVNGKMVWTSSAFSEKLNIYENNIYTLNTGDGNNNPFQNNGSNINVLHDGLWHHFAVTFGNNESKFYIDGEYRGTAINFRSPAITNGQIKLAGGYNKTHTYDWNGQIDDFRVYDHCLSPKEVKEISQGLVLHYKLDGSTFNINPNNYPLVPDGVELYDYILSSGTLWIDTEIPYSSTNNNYKVHFKFSMYGNKSSYDAIYGAYKGEGYKTLRFIRGNNNTSFLAYYNVKAGGGGTSVSSTLNNTYEVIQTKDYTLVKDLTNNISNIYNHKSATGSNISGVNIFLFALGSNSIPSKIKMHYWEIYDGNTLLGNFIPCTYLGEVGMWDSVKNKFYGNEGTNTFTLGLKLSLSNLTVYDSSGYLNNGIVTGSLTMVSDSSRYNMVTCFNGSSYINRVSLDSSSEVKTISFWANWSSVDFSLNYASQCILFVDNGTKTGFGLLSNKLILLTTSVAGESYTYPNQNFIANVWYHFVIVITGATTRDLYINGVKKTPTSSKNKWTYSVNQLQIGRRSTTSDGFNGKISDFRIYTTVLSDEDIKELYDTSAIIDNLNNLYTRELIEDNMDYVEISKKGIVKTDSLTEGNNGVIFSSDNIECNQLIEI